MSDRIREDELLNRFGYHRATKDSAPQHNAVRQLMLRTATELVELLPPGREANLALTTLQSSMMWANAAIAMENDVDTQHPDLPNAP